jgi:hypothetical protein
LTTGHGGRRIRAYSGRKAAAEKDRHSPSRRRPAALPARSDTVLVTSYTYDSAGRVQDMTDPRGIVARTLSDALGRTTATIANFTGAAPGSQTDVTTLFTFDLAGRLASRTAVQPAGTPSQVTGYVYGVSPATGSTITSNDLMAETSRKRTGIILDDGPREP